MIDLLGILTKNLILIVFINVLLEMLLPRGEFYRYIRMITGLVIILLVVGSLSQLLGRAPGRQYFVPELSMSGTGELTGMELQNVNNRQTISLYKEALHRLVRDEIHSTGEWVLLESEFAVEESPDNEEYGVLYSVEAVVRKGVLEGEEEIPPVNVAPVEKESFAEDHAPEPGEGERDARVPELELALARLLHLSPEVIIVRQ